MEISKDDIIEELISYAAGCSTSILGELVGENGDEIRLLLNDFQRDFSDAPCDEEGATPEQNSNMDAILDDYADRLIDTLNNKEDNTMSTKTTYYLAETNAGRLVLAVCGDKAFACKYDSRGIDANSGCDLYDSTDVLIEWYIAHKDELYSMDEIMDEFDDVFAFNEDDYENLTELVSIYEN